MTSEYRAAFIRGGTSKAVVFLDRDLPAARAERDEIFLRVMGSPDAYRRQLDGMGGGLSSLSKVCVVGPPSRAGADVDYTFAQVQVDRPAVDYAGNCGNMSSAIGPFAVEEGLVARPDGPASVRMHNVNTGKLIVSGFEVAGGRPVEVGGYRIPGVAGTGAPIRLDFLDPSGAGTGSLLPGDGVAQSVELPDGPPVMASLVDAANPVVFLDAASAGLAGDEPPDQIEAQPAVLAWLESARRGAAVAMGLAASHEDAGRNRMTPFVAVVAPPRPYRTLSGEQVSARDIDLVVRFLSSGQPHRALPVTGGLCTAVAAELPGSLVSRAARPREHGRPIRLGSPSGVLEVDARVGQGPGGFQADSATVYRTARRLFTGLVRA